MKTTKVKVLRPFYYNRTVQKSDDVIELPALFAMEVMAAKKAELVEEPAPSSKDTMPAQTPTSGRRTADGDRQKGGKDDAGK